MAVAATAAERSIRMFMKWACLCAMAELLGLGSAGVWYGAMNAWLGEPGDLVPRLGAWLLMSLAAVPEGVILGGLQALGLRWFFADASAARWISATVAVGLLGWGIGAFIPLFVVGEAESAAQAAPGLAATAAYAAAFGIAVGGVFGLAQAWALPPAAKPRVLWVIANALGWAVGMPLIFIAAQWAADYSGWLPRIALWACGGAAAGASVGIATGFALVRMRRPSRPFAA